MNVGEMTPPLSAGRQTRRVRRVRVTPPNRKGPKMATKNIEPTNPDKTSKASETTAEETRLTGRKTARKVSRKVSKKSA